MGGMMARPNLTAAQRRALKDLFDGRPVHADYGNHSLLALWRRGLVDRAPVESMRPFYSLTPAGRALLSETEDER